jgi:hypothetical protein
MNGHYGEILTIVSRVPDGFVVDRDGAINRNFIDYTVSVAVAVTVSASSPIATLVSSEP